MIDNPHHLLNKVEADHVGRIEIRHNMVQICFVEPHLSEEEIFEELWARNCAPGKYTCFGYHYSSKRQLPGYHIIELPSNPSASPPEVDNPDRLASSFLNRQFNLLDQAQKALDERSKELDQRERDLLNRQADLLEDIRQQQSDIDKQRHELLLKANDHSYELERKRDQAYRDRMAELDAREAAISTTLHERSETMWRERLRSSAEAAEQRIESIEDNMKQRLNVALERIETAKTASDPLAMLRLLPEMPKELASRLLDAQLPPSQDEPDGLMGQIQQVVTVLQQLRGAKPTVTTEQPESVPNAPPRITG